MSSLLDNCPVSFSLLADRRSIVWWQTRKWDFSWNLKSHTPSGQKRHSSAESEAPSKKQRANGPVTPPVVILLFSSDDESTTGSASVVSPSRRPRTPWTRDETMAFIQGVKRCGVGRWVEIKEWAQPRLNGRHKVQIKDKWPRHRPISRKTSVPEKFAKLEKSLKECCG